MSAGFAVTVIARLATTPILLIGTLGAVAAYAAERWRSERADRAKIGDDKALLALAPRQGGIDP